MLSNEQLTTEKFLQAVSAMDGANLVVPPPWTIEIDHETKELVLDYFTTPRLLKPLWYWSLRIGDKRWRWLKRVLATRKEREKFASIERMWKS